MNKNINLRNIVNESINNVLLERQKGIIKQIIKEEITNFINEKNDDNKQKRGEVLSTLKKKGIKQSEFAYALDPDGNKDTVRAEFSHKLNGKPDADGQVRKFTDDEINKLYYMIHNI